MKLNDPEVEWFNRLVELRLSQQDANILARLKCVVDQYQELHPDKAADFNEWKYKTGDFYQFCINCGRLEQSEMDALYSNFSKIENNSWNPCFPHCNPLKELWNYIKNSFIK